MICGLVGLSPFVSWVVCTSLEKTVFINVSIEVRALRCQMTIPVISLALFLAFSWLPLGFAQDVVIA
jgi:hypothetical protein